MPEAWTHSIPVFADGAQAARHHRVGAPALRAMARGASAPEAETFVQFAGFPRSGHSVIGAILGAHPEACIAHEMDAMGLIEAGFSGQETAALAVAFDRAWTEGGRWWNGFRYEVEGAASGRVRVIGDKKGDMTVRRLAKAPELLEALRARMAPMRCAFVSVLRDPRDNVATMALRRSRVYDRVRMRADGADDFRRRLARRQAAEDVDAAVPMATVRNYAALCDGLAALRARVAPADWIELRHEDFCADPAGTIRGLLARLDLADADGFAARAARLAQPAPSRTRDLIGWPPDVAAALERVIGRHDFLASYRA